MQALLGTLICLSPVLFIGLGYYVGRYGSPLILRIQRPRDRRRPVLSSIPSSEDEGIDVYQAVRP